jgi:N-acylneuraminate cytidylyltransferase
MIVAIIPARGGSKRIPRKNIRLFAGKPIIAYSIAAAQKCGLFDRIVVSTDDAEIAAVARDCGAETPFVRPPELSDEHTGTVAVTGHALTWLAEHGCDAALACCIYATAPFLTGEDLRRGHDVLIASGKTFAFSVTSFPFPIQRALRIAPDGVVAAMHPQWIEWRSQDLEEAHHDAGQFYWGRAGGFREKLSLYAGNAVPVVLPRYRVQDIDTVEDWRQAELMYGALMTAAASGKS